MSSLNESNRVEEPNQTEAATNSDATVDNAVLTSNVSPVKELGGLNKLISVVEKITETNREKEDDEQKTILTTRTLKFMTDKKVIAARSKMFQSKLESLEECKLLDLQDSQTCELVIFLLQKPIKTAQEVSFLGKFMKGLSLFSQREELFQTQQLSGKMIQNLRCVFVQKQNSLFRYGDRGHEYFILLKGKAYCLVPYSNMVPMDQIKTQTKNNRLLNQVTEDEADEDYLFEYYPRHQCVKIYHPGEAFGEIALLTSESRRMASIVCKEDSWFMSLDREGFKQIQGSYQQHLLNERVYFLKQFEIFASVAVNKILSFLHEITESSFTLGQSIYTQNDKLSNVYFIMEGEVELIHRISQQFPSRLDKQKYEKYFHNTKMCNLTKQVVLLSRGNYFGDEDLLSPGLRRTFSAVVKSPLCKLMVIESRQLVQFLKVYECFSILKTTAGTKRERYMDIIDQFKKEHYVQDTINKDENTGNKSKTAPNTLSKSSSNIMGSLLGTSTKIESSKIDDELLAMLNESKSNEKRSEGMSKYHNLYSQEGNANMRAKNYMSLHSAHNNTCKFTINDVPMTTTMNQNPNDLRRIQFRLKNKQISVLGPEQSEPHHSLQQESKLKIADNLVKHSLVQPESDSIHLPQGYSILTRQKWQKDMQLTQNQQSSIEQSVNHRNSFFQESFTSTPHNEHSIKVPRVDLSPQLTFKAEESLNHRKKQFISQQQTHQQGSNLDSKPNHHSSSHILASLTNQILKSTTTLSKPFDQSALNQTSTSNKHSQIFLSSSMSNLMTKTHFNSTHNFENIGSVQGQKQQQQQQSSLPLISSEFNSQAALGKRSSLQLTRTHYTLGNQHSKNQETNMTSSIETHKNKHFQVLKTEGHRKTSPASLNQISYASGFPKKTRKSKKESVSPEMFAMRYSISTNSNDYQQKLLLKKHLPLIETSES